MSERRMQLTRPALGLAALLVLGPGVLPAQRASATVAGLRAEVPATGQALNPVMTGQDKMSATTNGLLIGGAIGFGAGLAVALAFAADSDGGGVYLPFALVPAALGAVIGASIGARSELPPSRPAP